MSSSMFDSGGYMGTSATYPTTWSIVSSGLQIYLDAGLTASYPGTGTTWTDLVNSVSTTLTNGPTFSSSNGGSIVFDGTNDFCVGTTSTINRTNGSAITVSCWFKPSRNAGQYQMIAENRSNDASLYNWMLYQHTTDGAISFHGANQNKSTSTTSIPTVNTWVNATATVTAAGISTLYINGSAVYSFTGYTYGNSTTTSNLTVGANGNGSEAFQGSISIVKVYNIALTQEQITQNYNALKGRFGL